MLPALILDLLCNKLSLVLVLQLLSLCISECEATLCRGALVPRLRALPAACACKGCGGWRHPA